MSLARRKLQKIGNSTGVTIPADMLVEAKMRRGAEVMVSVEPGRVTLTLIDNEFDRAVAAAERFIARHPNALRKLAE